ncbi:MAG: PP2C family protein-serine/threonine phosphatase [Planctomycetota bacterium]
MSPVSCTDRPALHIDPSADAAIYRQIANQIRDAIAEGRLAPGQALPGTRELAVRLVTAPRHVERAFLELERLGLIRLRTGREVTPLDEADRNALDVSLDAARAVQRQLLPRPSLRVPGYELSVVSSAADRLSGDFHDVFSTEDGRLAVLAGDVSGHGVGPALVGSAAQSALRSCLNLVTDPLRAVRAIDRDLCERTDDDVFVSLFVGLADEDGRWRYLNAGHPTPLVWRHASATIERLHSTGTALGIEHPLDLGPLRTTTLRSGDLLVVYSDGLVEARLPDAPGGMLGTAGVQRLLATCAARGGSAREVARCLAASARDLRATGAEDDLTVLVLRRL